MRGRRTSQAQTEKMLRVVGKYMAEHEGASQGDRKGVSKTGRKEGGA